MSFSPTEPTYSVSELCAEIRTFLTEAFPSLWVAGEVGRMHVSRRGHAYFELVEKGEHDEVRAKLDAVIWRSDHQRIQRILSRHDQRLEEGVEIRCRGSVDFYGAGGRLQLVVREVDPVFTLGLLAQRRRETLAALAAEGLLDRNRALELPTLPRRIALVTSEGSAAYHDFLTTLEESGFAFRVLLLHAAVQGKAAERQVVSALETLGTTDVDLAVLIRGGGSRSDLAVFDSRAIAEAIARAPVPVVTGLGHQIDESIADRVAHTSLKTPTKVAEFLIDRMLTAERAVAETGRSLRQAVLDRLRSGREALGSAERGVELARMRLATAGGRVEELARALERTAKGALAAEARRRRELAARLGMASRRNVARGRHEPRRLAERLVASARGRLREVTATLDGYGRLATQLAPERTLERGYSITRNERGELLRRADRVEAGERVSTRLATGSLTSRVEETVTLEPKEER